MQKQINYTSPLIIKRFVLVGLNVERKSCLIKNVDLHHEATRGFRIDFNFNFQLHLVQTSSVLFQTFASCFVNMGQHVHTEHTWVHTQKVRKEKGPSFVDLIMFSSVH